MTIKIHYMRVQFKFQIKWRMHKFRLKLNKELNQIIFTVNLDLYPWYIKAFILNFFNISYVFKP